MIEEDLERINFSNLVYFFKDELKRIQEGERGSWVFTQRMRTCLKAKGILSKHQ